MVATSYLMDSLTYIGVCGGLFTLARKLNPKLCNRIGELAHYSINQTTKSMSSNKNNISQINQDPSAIYHRWEFLKGQRKNAVDDINVIKEFVLERLGLIKDENKLHTQLNKINTYFNRRVLFQEKEEWNENLKQIWEDRKNLLSEKGRIPSEFNLKNVLIEMNQYLTNTELLKEAAKGFINSKKFTTEQQAKETYVEFIKYCKIEQESIAWLIDELEKDDSAANKLLPIIPDFDIKPLRSPFSSKQTLESYFKSQNIAGLPEGLNDVVVTVAAAYDTDYKNSVEDLGIHPERGMILYGPPGTGKTVMAKAIAEYLGCSQKNIKILSGSNLLDKYVGSTEKGIRDLFEEAKQDSKNLHVIIIDEIDSILSKRDEAKNSWEISRVTQFLTELDGINSPKNIFVVGITNHLTRLDPAVTRPGRLGSLIEVPLPNELQRENIFALYLEKINNNFLPDSPQSLANILAKESDGFSGAEIKAAVERTSNVAFMKMIQAQHFEQNKEPSETQNQTPLVIEVSNFFSSLMLIKDQKNSK